MKHMSRRLDHRELPPTAGLPLTLKDLLPSPSVRLADALRDFIGSVHSWTTCSGTAALVVALSALAKRSPRREVIVPAWTCPLVAIAVAHCGLRLRLCDLRRDHFDMDPNALARLCGPTTLAIIPTHLAGRVADVATAAACASACGAYVIEDAAQALGARHVDGTPAGAMGDIGIFSFAAGKGLSVYEGGLLTTRRQDLCAQLQQSLATNLPGSTIWEWRRCIEMIGYAALYNPNGLRLVYGRPLRRALHAGDATSAVGDRFSFTPPLHRISHWRAGVAASAAARLPAFLDALHAQALPRLQALREIHGITVFGDIAGTRGTWPFFLLLLPSQSMRDAVLERLWTRGVGVTRLFIHALCDYAYLRPLIDPVNVPNARDFAARSLTISNTLWMDEATFTFIVDTLKAVLVHHPLSRVAAAAARASSID
ncbi:MAG TPA: DegT/DnrJ/EryC1/StrS family aminotransferase [Rhodanobacteraceae bacterium]